MDAHHRPEHDTEPHELRDVRNRLRLLGKRHARPHCEARETTHVGISEQHAPPCFMGIRTPPGLVVSSIDAVRHAPHGKGMKKLLSVSP